MKKRSAWLAALVCALGLLLSGCAVEPYTVKWEFVSCMVKGGGTYCPAFDEIHHKKTLEWDSVRISFAENGSFTFHSIDGTNYSGTYTYENKKGETLVELRFGNEECASGTCRKYAFDGVWYEADFTIFDVLYHFEENQGLHGSYYEEGIAEVRERLAWFSAHPSDADRDDAEHGGFVRASVERMNGMTFLKTAEKTYCLDDAFDLGVYTYDETFTPTEHESEALGGFGGSCIAYIRETSVNVPPHGEEYSVYSFALYFAAE